MARSRAIVEAAIVAKHAESYIAQTRERLNSLRSHPRHTAADCLGAVAMR